jgi:predicted AlkP superfamily phosphohydrolase/phosphomutase
MPEKRRKVAVFGLDCATPQLVFGQFREHLPNIKALMDTGVWGRLRSSDPPITCPAWMVMLTGATPGELGIYGFRNRTDHSYENLATANSTWIRRETVWDVLSREGLESAVFAVPLTYPPKPLRGRLVGCFLTPGPDAKFTQPPALREELRAACGPYQPDAAEFRTDDKDALYARILSALENHEAYCRHLLTCGPWDFFMMVEMGVDRMHHGYWKYFDPQHREYAPGNPHEGKMLDFYRRADQMLGRLWEQLPDDAWITVVSDHGARPLEGVVRFNEWLIQKGLLTLRQRPATPVALNKCEVDWTKTKAWGDGGYYGRCFLNIRGREPSGTIPPEEVESFKAQLTDELVAMTDERGALLGNVVLRPEKIYPKVNGVAPDLIVYFGGLRYRSAGLVGGSEASVLAYHNDTGPDDANHDLEGIFIAGSKARMRAGTPGKGELSGLRIEQTAATLLHMAGVVPPQEMGSPLALNGFLDA